MRHAIISPICHISLIRLITPFLFSLFILHPSLYGAAAPLIRASLATSGTTFTGQRLTLVIELLAPGYFDSAATFDLPDPHGLLLVPPQGSPTINSETIDGIAYTAQRHELALFSPRPGTQTLPPITVRFAYKLAPLDKDAQRAELHTPALTFTVTSPPGAENLGQVISTRNLTATESWHPKITSTTQFKTADALTRTITYTAPDIPGMLFPPFPHAPIDGLGIYPKAPEILDTTDRGQLTGSRRDTTTYICEQSGTYTIPGARLTWFDLDSNQLRTINFPERTFTVLANPALTSDASTPAIEHSETAQTNSHISRILTALAILFLLAYASWRFSRSRHATPFRPLHLQPLNPPEKK